MKIGIMTFPNMTSYGCSLQMYALYRAVEQTGGEVEIVNYQNPYMKAGRHTSGAAAGKLRLWASKTLHLRQAKGFRSFERRMKLYPEKPISAEKLPKAAKRYDGVICGSDQVWNPNITDMDMSFFLDFCGSDTKRIAYAPSFGISEFKTEFTTRIATELKKFAHLSVRERDGAELVGELTGKTVETVLDPTFLIPQKEWVDLEHTYPLAKGKYVLYFPVRKSANLFRFSRELAQKRNAQLVAVEGNIITRMRNKDKRVSYALDLSPEEWLNLVHHADCIVTNSFHGAAFAIHYQKDYYLDLSSKTNSRLEQLMDGCGLRNRIVSDDCARWDEPIDYLAVEARLAPERVRSLDYLKKSIWT